MLSECAGIPLVQFVRVHPPTFVHGAQYVLVGVLPSQKGMCFIVCISQLNNSSTFLSLSCLVCIDVCFTQKNNKHSTRDPKHEHPKTVFVDPEEVEVWKDFVEEVRPRKDATAKSRKGHPTPDEEDGFEGSMKVPNSVLEACGESFTAADGDRLKASTQFFDSTALMGLLCRHDRVLWLVNLTTPGE